MSTWFAILELPFLLLATAFGFLTARAVKSSSIWRGMTFIALGSLLMAVGHIIMMADQLLKEHLLTEFLGNVGGAWAWLVALCTSWLFYGLGFFWIYEALPQKETELRLVARSHERTVDALHHSEYLYRSLVEAVRDVIYTLSPDGMITSLNPAFELHTGWSRAEWIGQPYAPIVHPEDLPLAMERFRQVLAGESLPCFTLRIREKTGGYWVGEFVQTSQLRNGEVVGVLGVCRDVTDRIMAEEALRRAHDELERRVQERTAELEEANRALKVEIEERQRIEEALRRSEERFRKVFEGAPIGISITDHSYHLVMVNRAFSTMLGYTQEELTTKTFLDITHPDDVALSVRGAEEVFGGPGRVGFEKRYVKKTGEVLLARLTVSPLHGNDGKIHWLVALIEDITEHKQAEEALRESNERFRSITQSAHDAIIVADQQGHIQSWNRGAQLMFGYTETEVLNQPLTLLMPTRYHEAHSRAIARVTRTGESRLVGQTIELMGLRKDGTEFPLELSLAMWWSKTGTFFSGIIRELTERKRNEQARARLAAMVFEEEERRRLARELHDQIGQLLTALKLTLEAAGRQPDVTSGGKLEIAQRSVEELIRRVHDMSLDLRPPMLDDLGLLPALLWLFQRCADQTNVQVTFQHTGIERRFEQEVETAAYRIVQEALTNVARHARATSAMVRVWADSSLWVQIEDKGIGFDLNAKAGTTLGLTGMQERARGLGGDLTVESAPGRSTRVTAELPLERRVKQWKLEEV